MTELPQKPDETTWLNRFMERRAREPQVRFSSDVVRKIWNLYSASEHHEELKDAIEPTFLTLISCDPVQPIPVSEAIIFAFTVGREAGKLQGQGKRKVTQAFSAMMAELTSSEYAIEIEKKQKLR